MSEMPPPATATPPHAPLQHMWAAWGRTALTLVLSFVVAFGLARAIEPGRETAQSVAAQALVREKLAELREPLALMAASGADAAADAPARADAGSKADVPAPSRARVQVALESMPAARDAIWRELSSLRGVEFVDASLGGIQNYDGVMDLRLQEEAGGRALRLSVALRTRGMEEVVQAEASRRLSDWTALLPPIVALVLALVLRRLLLALGLAVWTGAVAASDFHPLEGSLRAVSLLHTNATQSFNLYIIGFTFALVGMVHVISRMGGMAAVLALVSDRARSARDTRLATFGVGLAIFFDDYANTIVTGTTMRPLTDAWRISREKLAYLVDSTSAPIAGIAIISTWIGYEVGLFDDLSRQLGLGMGGYEIFLQIMPMRFYCILSLVFVLMVAWSGRDFGPMYHAERRALVLGEVSRPGATLLTGTALQTSTPKPGVQASWYHAAVPVGLVIAANFMGMFWSGWQGPQGELLPAVGGAWPESGAGATLGLALGDLLSANAWRKAFSGANGAQVLFFSALLGSLVAIGMAVGQGLLTLRESLAAWMASVSSMWMAVAILFLAWAIRSVCDDLGTSLYLVGAAQGYLSLAWMPLLSFGLAALVGFATGTSWGTMGILLPTMVPLAYYLSGGADTTHWALLLTFAAVLDGAIFGDHCSPISDTTVMSSIASSCDHIDHVRTQLPYAVSVMLVAALAGYTGVGMGMAPWLSLVVGTLMLGALLWVVGRPVDVAGDDAARSALGPPGMSGN